MFNPFYSTFTINIEATPEKITENILSSYSYHPEKDLRYDTLDGFFSKLFHCYLEEKMPNNGWLPKMIIKASKSEQNTNIQIQFIPNIALFTLLLLWLMFMYFISTQLDDNTAATGITTMAVVIFSVLLFYSYFFHKQVLEIKKRLYTLTNADNIPDRFHPLTQLIINILPHKELSFVVQKQPDTVYKLLEYAQSNETELKDNLQKYFDSDMHIKKVGNEFNLFLIANFRLINIVPHCSDAYITLFKVDNNSNITLVKLFIYMREINAYAFLVFSIIYATIFFTVILEVDIFFAFFLFTIILINCVFHKLLTRNDKLIEFVKSYLTK